VSEDVWYEQDTNPDAIEAALRTLLFRRHAENEALVPARVLNLVVIVDREWKGEITNRLERVGRYQASRTVLCAFAERRTQLDALAIVRYEEPGAGSLGVVREHVEIDLGPEHLEALDTIIDPVLALGMPTIAWSPHGHDDAVQRILRLIDVILLDSDDLSDPADAFARAGNLSGHAYIVDLAWLRTTPWRERLAASFDLPLRRPGLERVEELEVYYREHSTASALLLTGWLASRLQWERSRLAVDGGGRLSGTLRRAGGEVGVSMRTLDQDAPGLGGVTVGSDHGASLSLQRGNGGLDATERLMDGTTREWKILGASRGEGGILGEGVRQALLRDPTYGPALDAARELCPA
jgi:glucose-6-phosphate dehydrogenase assembly protein OpcA